MHRLKQYLIVWFICGVICMKVGPSCGEHLQSTNGTAVQSIRTQERPSPPSPSTSPSPQKQQSQYEYGSSKPANKPNHGRSGLDQLRKNLNQTKLWERQGDDPDQSSGIRSPIHIIKEKITQSDVSRNI